MQKIKIQTEFITLGQLLKYASILQSGGEVKSFLAVTKVTVNAVFDNRRGRKLYPGDRVSIGVKPPIELVIADEN